jgi:predicted nucleic acid-binding protein
VPKRVMLDTNVYDLVVARAGFTARLQQAVRAGAVEILRTRVQEEEIARIPDPKKRAALRKIPGRRIETVSPPPGPWPSDDALIAMTAEAEADALVTEDKELRERVAATRLEVWRFDQLVDFIGSLSG